MLSFYLEAVVDINECDLDFFECSERELKTYIRTLHDTVTKETMELQGAHGSILTTDELCILFTMFQIHMKHTLPATGRR